MGEIKNPENSGVSDPSGDEQIDEEGGEDEGTEGDKETSVVESSAEEPADEAVEPTTAVPEDENVEPSEEIKSNEEINLGGADTMAADKTEATVNVVFQVDPSDRPDLTEDEKKEPDAYDSDSEDAEVDYTNGCVDGGVLISGFDLTFKVAPVAGRVLTKIEKKIGDPTDEKVKASSVSASPAVGEEYTIKRTDIIKGTGDKQVANPVTIIITTKTASHKIKFTKKGDAAVQKYKIYALKDDSEDEIEKTEYDGSAADAVKFGDEKSFAIVMEDDSNKLVSAKLGGKDVEIGEETELTQQDADPAPKGHIITVNPSEYTDTELGMTGTETEANVEVTARAAYALSMSVEAKDANVTIKQASGDDYKDDIIGKVESGSLKFDDITENSAEDFAKTLYFMATPEKNYGIGEEGVKATLTKEGEKEGTPLEVSGPTEIKDEDDETVLGYVYGVSLSQALEDGALTANAALKVEVSSELTDDDENLDIRTISFKENPEGSRMHAKIYAGENADGADEWKNAEKNEDKTTLDAYKFKITPDTGFQFTTDEEETNEDDSKNELYGKEVITITENRIYKADGDDYVNPVPYEHKEEAAGDKTFTLTLKGKASEDDVDAEVKGKDYVTTSVEVAYGIEVQSNDEEKIVIFDDKLTDNDLEKKSYNVTLEGVVLDEYAETGKEGRTYAIAKSTDTLKFSVTAVAEPLVKVGGDPVAFTSGGEGVWNYEIPTQPLDAEDATTITIDKKAGVKKGVRIKADTNDLLGSGGFSYKLNNTETLTELPEADEGEEYAEFLEANQPAVGDTVEFIFKAKAGVTIESVTGTMGDTPLTGEIKTEKDGKMTATLKTTVTDAIVLDVNTKSNYVVNLEGEPGTTLRGKDGVYTADYGEKKLKVQLYRRGEDATEAFYDIAVKEGGSTAVTRAKLDTGKEFATIDAIDKSEYGKTLTIEVTRKRGETYTATLQVSAPSESVTVTDMTSGKAVKETEPIEVMSDSQISFKVSAANGANENDLTAAIYSAKEGASSADNTAARKLASATAIEDGIVTVTVDPKAKAGDEVLLCITNANAAKADKDKPLTGGTVKLQIMGSLVQSGLIKDITAQEGTATNRGVSLSAKLNFANAKNAPAKPHVGDLYWKIEYKSVDTSVTGATKAKASDLSKVTKIDPVDGSYNGADLAYFDPVTLITEYKKDGTVYAGDVPGIATANVAVTLVQSLSEKELTNSSKANTDYVAGPTVDLVLNTKLPVFENKLSLKAVNGATVFTGQKNAVVANPSFTKDVSYTDNLQVEFVNTKTGQKLGDSSDENEGIASYGQYSAKIGQNNAILVSAGSSVHPNDADTKRFLSTFGLKVTADYPDEGYAASAVLKLKVQQGIVNLEADQTKAAVPDKLYKASNKKASVKITPKYNSGAWKPAKAAVTWEISGENGASTDTLSKHMQEALTGKKPLVSVKNGTVTVDAKYTLGAEETDNTFYVTMRAADYTGESAYGVDRTETKKFVISGEGQTIGKLVVVNSSNVPQPAASLKAEDFKQVGGLYVAAVKSDAKEPAKDVGYETADFIPVTFKISGKLLSVGSFDSSAMRAPLTFSKPGKNIKLTATTVDGGKKKADLVLSVNAYEKLGLRLEGSNGIATAPDVTNIAYTGGSNQRYTLNLEYMNGSAWTAENSYKNMKVTVKGGKFIANKEWAKNSKGLTNTMGDVVVVSDFKTGAATITLTDTAIKKTVATYTIKNNGNSSVKAPSIKMVEPKKVDKNTKSVTWQINKKTDFAGKYVMLTPDFTVAKSTDPYVLDAYKLVDDGGKVVKVDENNEFTLDTVKYDENGDIEAKPLYDCRNNNGTVKLVATVGDMVGGEFVPAAKDSKLNFKLAKERYNANLSVKASYSLDANRGRSAVIEVKTDDTYQVSDAMNVISAVKDQTTDLHSNAFTTYFEVRNANVDLRNETSEHDGKYAYIALKDTLSPDQIKYITDAKLGKNDRTGYITVENDQYRKDIKITVSFKEKKLTAAAPVLFANTAEEEKVPVTVYDGRTPIAIAAAMLDPQDDKSFAKSAEVTKDGTFIVTTQKGFSDGKKEVKLLVVPADTAYTVNTPLTSDPKSKKLTAKEILEQYSVPVTLKLDVKATGSKKVAALTTKFTVDNIKYGHGVENGYDIDSVAKLGDTGDYVIDVNYKLAGANLTVDDKKVTVDLAGNEVMDGRTKLQLVKAAAVKVPTYRKDGSPIVDDKGKAVTKDVIQLRINKKALSILSDQVKADKKAKVAASYGKKLTVPVTLQYNTSKSDVTTETIKFTLQLPKEPMSFAEVQAKVQSAGINSIKTKALDTTDKIIGRLKDDVYKKVSEVVPADTDVIVGVPVVQTVPADEEEDPAEDDDQAMTDGKAQVIVTLTDHANKDTKTNTKDMPWTFDLGILSSVEADTDIADTVKTTIESILGSYQWDNNVTAASLESDIKGDKKLEAYGDVRRGNVSIKVTDFNLTPATAKNGGGSVALTVRVKNLLTGREAEISKNGGNKYTFTKLNNITEAYGAVKTELSAANLKQFIEDCAGDEETIRNLITAEAVKAAKNPGITISYKEETWNYKPVIKKGGVDEDEQTLADGRNGTLTFTLLLNDNGRIRELDCEATPLEVPGDGSDYFISMEKAVEEVNKALDSDPEDEDEYEELIAALKADSTKTEESLKGVVQNLANGALASAKGFKAEVENFSYRKATAKQEPAVSFTIAVSYKKGSTEPDRSISVEDLVFDEADKAAMTKTEMREMLGEFSGYETKTAVPTALDGAISAIKTYLTTEVFVSQTGELKGATLEVTKTASGDNKSVFTLTEDKSAATVTNVQITVKRNDKELYSELKSEITITKVEDETP